MLWDKLSRSTGNHVPSEVRMLSAGVQRASGADEFLLAIVHDMRVHLRKSMTRAQRLAIPSLPPLAAELQGHVTEIIAADREMDVLLARLAKYAVAGRDPREKPANSIQVMVHSALTRLAHKSQDVNIDTTHYHRRDLLAPHTFEMALSELLDNALKFRTGPVKITLTVEQLPAEVVFGVADTGIGFAPQYAEKVMRPLERLHPISVYPGCGMGLPICQRMVEAWGGRLWVESRLGSGSTFWFSMPA